MDTEGFAKLHAPSDSGDGSENPDPFESVSEALEAESLPLNSEVKHEIHGEASVTLFDGLCENMVTLMATDVEKDVDSNTTALPVSFELTESVVVVKEMISVNSVDAENGSLAVESESSFSHHKKDGTVLGKRGIDAISLSGVKRPQITVDEPQITVDESQPSVHVTYNSLTRESKQKLEELLQQWSRWHSEKCSPTDKSNVVLESGEETYFPALRVGLDKPSAVTFWVDNQTRIQSNKENIQLDGYSVPLYDRGYSLALSSADGSSSLDGGVEEYDTSRCFNCGSYSHSLKDCNKPRDNVAVNNARKQHKAKRNLHTSSRNSTRYYQSSRGGKYDGLTPGVLDAETRKLLGLGELDPPPWLNRMREIGYPPGYLDPDLEDQPSGIQIIGDEVNKEEGEEGEILDGSYCAEPSRKMTVEFPGVNGPIPENADKRLWADCSSRSSPSRDRSYHRSDHSFENLIRPHYSEQRWSRDFDDDGPPGCEPGTSPSLSYHFRCYGYDSNRSPLDPQASTSIPTFSGSLPDRGRSPFRRDGYPYNDKYDTLSYSSPR